MTESPRSVVGEVDGVLLTGGGDVDPVFYKQERHPAVYDAEAGRDEFEIDLARRALDGDVPLFAICRGMQVLNVAAGGTLIQDIPTQIDTPLRHAVDTPKDALAHVVHVTAASALAQALGAGRGTAAPLPVNSRHHQSVGDVAPGLAVTATAPDGIVEAIERSGRGLLPRRPVASGKLLAHRRVQAAVRGVCCSREAGDRGLGIRDSGFGNTTS